MSLLSWIRKQVVLRAAKKGLKKAGVPEETVDKIMSGWKTWVGGLLLVATGLVQILTTLKKGDFDFGEIQAGLATIGAGFAAVGIGHKVEKAADKVVGG